MMVAIIDFFFFDIFLVISLHYTADAMVSTGLAALGYQYINIGRTTFTNFFIVVFLWFQNLYIFIYDEIILMYYSLMNL